jgi:hypothetical protein
MDYQKKYLKYKKKYLILKSNIKYIKNNTIDCSIIHPASIEFVNLLSFV